MSEYLKKRTKMQGAEFERALRETCQAQGIAFEQGDLLLFDYWGRRQRTKAQYVIRREYIGGPSNDLGFQQNEDGYIEIIYDGDSRHTLKILAEINTRYSYHLLERAARRKGVTLSRYETLKRTENGGLRVQVSMPTQVRVRR